MMLGMSLATFTAVHVIISLVAIFAGLIMLVGMTRGADAPGWTTLFLITTVLTSVTGFMFPPKPIGPPHVFGVMSLLALAIALVALYRYKLAGAWRLPYVVTVILALYLNVVVLVVQTFQKIAFFHQFAPTQKEAPFLATQLTVLALFVFGGVLAAKRFHRGPAPLAAAPAV